MPGKRGDVDDLIRYYDSGGFKWGMNPRVEGKVRQLPGGCWECAVCVVNNSVKRSSESGVGTLLLGALSPCVRIVKLQNGLRS